MPLLRTPPDPRVPGSEFQRRGREGKGRHRRVAKKGEVFDLMAEKLPEPQIVKKADEALPEAVFLVVPDRPDSQGAKLPQFSHQNGRFSLDLFVHSDQPSSASRLKTTRSGGRISRVRKKSLRFYKPL